MFEPLFGIPIAVLSLSQPIPQRIAVKIFPHLHNTSPEGIDPVPGRVTLKSGSSCEIYRGDTESASSSGVLQSTVEVLDLDLASIDVPLWIQCEGPIKVLRRGVKTSYSYSGPIYAHAIPSGPELIEVKTLNDYLKGVVPSEMPASWPAEALQAQAIAARTYAVFHITLARQSWPSVEPHPFYDVHFYDVDDTVDYQAYTGELNRTAASDRAVEETGADILTYRGQVIQAYFSADAGGYTEDADHVWPVDAPYCLAKPEPFENISGAANLDRGVWHPWKVKLSLSWVNRRLCSAGLISSTKPALDFSIDPAQRDESGRARSVTATLADGSKADLDALRFQHALGLRSTLITAMMVAPATKLLEIDGRGFGHGVGMSQLGARLAALIGWDHFNILNFYYTDIQLCGITAKGSLDCDSSSRLQ